MKVEQYSGEDSLILDVEFQRLSVDLSESFGPDYLEPTLPVQQTPFISAAVLATKAKQFDDGLYAAVEFIVQNGSGKLASKRELLKKVATYLLGLNETLSKGSLNVLAASRLGGSALQLSGDVERAVSQIEKEFLSDDVKSKPISFYTWSPELAQIFQQDRILQEKLRSPEFKQVISAIKQQDLSANYLGYLTLVSKLTNPVVNAGLSMYLSSPEAQDLKDSDKFSMLPPSASPEGELVKKLFGALPIPEDFELMQEVIDRLRSGQLDFTPTAQSGWYDYQLWSNEPLVIPEKMPEKIKVTMEEKYSRKLEEFFKGLYALARETHAKQLEIPVAGCAPPMKTRKEIYIRPECSIELLPSHYFRRAKTYQFLKAILIEHLGEECLKKDSRLTKNGPVELCLFDELNKMIQLYYGAYCQACHDLAMPADDIGDAQLDQSECRRHLNIWYQDAKGNDADIGQDMRMMVPVFFDAARRKTKVWLFMGWTKAGLRISYKNTPKLLTVNGEEPDRDRYDVNFSSSFYQAAYPAFAEVYVDRIFDRDEFRAHCDKYRTVDDIVANLPGARVASAAE